MIQYPVCDHFINIGGCLTPIDTTVFHFFFHFIIFLSV